MTGVDRLARGAKEARAPHRRAARAGARRRLRRPSSRPPEGHRPCVRACRGGAPCRAARAGGGSRAFGGREAGPGAATQGAGRARPAAGAQGPRGSTQGHAYAVGPPRASRARRPAPECCRSREPIRLAGVHPREQHPHRHHGPRGLPGLVRTFLLGGPPEASSDARSREAHSRRTAILRFLRMLRIFRVRDAPVGVARRSTCRRRHRAQRSP